VRFLAAAGLFLAFASGRASAADYAIEPIDPPALGYHTKQIRALGVTVRAPGEVDDANLRGVVDQLAKLLEGMAPEHLERLAYADLVMSVYPRAGRLTDLPEMKGRKGTADAIGRAWGAGAGCLEADPRTGSEIRKEACLHEWAYLIHRNALHGLEHLAITRRYRDAMASRLWEGTYAAKNHHEFFAVASERFFGGNYHSSQFPEEAFARQESGSEWVAWYDSATHDLLEAIYRGEDAAAKVSARRERLERRLTEEAPAAGPSS
jgi:hypothetical protein